MSHAKFGSVWRVLCGGADGLRRSVSAVSLVGALLGVEPASALIWPNEIAQVEEDLTSTDAVTRRQGARHLLQLPRDAALRLLPRAMADSDGEVRVLAAQAAIRFRYEPAPASAIAWLSDREASVRRVAAELLGEFPATLEVVQALSRALGDPEVRVRLAAIEALGDSEHPDASLPLLGQLDDSNPKLQIAAIEALMRLRDPRSVVPLVGKIQDLRPAVRVAVARALGVLGGERVAAALVLALRDGEPEVRLAAVFALGKVGGADATDALVHVLHTDESMAVRVSVLTALGQQRDAETARVLIATLDSDHAELASEAKRALARRGGSAFAELAKCLRGQAPIARADGCAYALSRNHTEEAREVLVGAWRRRAISADAALLALAELQDPEALPVVLESLADSDPWVRRRAFATASVLLHPDTPDGRAVEPLLEAAERAASRPEELLSLVTLLGRTGSLRVAEVLSTHAQSKRVRLRLAAIRGLGQVRATSRQGLLFEALEDPEAAVRYAASVALRRAGDERLVVPLLRAFDRASVQQGELIATALAGPLSKPRASVYLEQVEQRILLSTGGLQDAWIEALAHAPEPSGGATLARLVPKLGSGGRAKVAEALAGHPDQRTLLRELSAVQQSAARAHAVWSLGSVAQRDDLPLLMNTLDDPEGAVAANAAVSWARTVVRTGGRVAPSDVGTFCESLEHSSPAVRTNVLVGLSLIEHDCPDLMVSRLLQRDPSPSVREAAARLLQRLPPRPETIAALRRCGEEDRDGRVARACLGEAPERTTETQSVTVFVVPPAAGEPEAQSPFSLVFADGTVRHGVADRRGAVYEPWAPRGPLRLDVPLFEGAW